MAILFLGISCARRDSISIETALLRADTLMNARPDSALHILQQVHIPDRLAPDLHAAWRLLTVQALYKNDILQNDSLVNLVIDYYTSTQDMHALAKAYHYRGCIEKERRQPISAQQNLLQSIRLASEAGDEQMKLRSSYMLAYLYSDMRLPEKSDSMYRITERMAIEQQDTIFRIEALQHQGIIYRDYKQYELAEKYLLQAEQLSGLFADQALQKETAVQLSTLYSRIHDGSKALHYARRALEAEQDTTLYPNIYVRIGDAYYQLRNYDSVDYYMTKALLSPQHHIKVGAYMRLAKAAKARNDFVTATEMERLSRVYTDSMHIANSTTPLEHSLSYSSKPSTYSSRLYGWNNHYLWIFLALCAIVAIGILIRRRRQLLHHTYIEKEATIPILPEEDKIEVVSMQGLNILQAELKQSVCYMHMQDCIQYYKARNKSNDSVTNEDKASFYEMVNNVFPNHMNRLISAYPSLSHHDIYFCYLHLTGLSATDIGALLNRTRSFVYKKRTILLTKKMYRKKNDSFMNAILFPENLFYKNSTKIPQAFRILLK
ncbi:MAG: hypothetical protein LBM61_08700 [Prevotellaceae bacterium]|jgi:tetratricopeptide (TPR) repeat protein|nr:hypothetical protein [Prevotellaceae bacterium]